MLTKHRYSKIRAEACPSLKTMWRLERRLRKEGAKIGRHIWLSSATDYPHVGDALILTSVGTLRIVPSGAVRRDRGR